MKIQIDIPAEIRNAIHDHACKVIRQHVPLFEHVPADFMVGGVSVSVNLSHCFPGTKRNDGNGYMPSPAPFPLERRLSTRYRDGWSYLDDNRSFGSVSVAFKSDSRDDDGDGYSYTLIVSVDSTLRPANVERCLHDTFSGSRCRCEHDCCGCVSTHVASVTHISDKLWRVEISATRNI